MKQHDTDGGDASDRHGEAFDRDNGGGQWGDSEENLLHHDCTRAIIGAYYSTRSQLGIGFLEAVYANALAVLLRGAGLSVQREVPFDIDFHGHLIGRYRADLIVESKVVVEVKCARAIDDAHVAQVRNYLRASGLRVGLVLNFARKTDLRRVIA